MLLSRAEAAQFLAESLPIKTETQWQTFLNDNAKNRNSPKIKFKSSGGRGSKSFYEQTALNEFIESLKTHQPHSKLYDCVWHALQRESHLKWKVFGLA